MLLLVRPCSCGRELYTKVQVYASVVAFDDAADGNVLCLHAVSLVSALACTYIHVRVSVGVSLEVVMKFKLKLLRQHRTSDLVERLSAIGSLRRRLTSD